MQLEEWKDYIADTYSAEKEYPWIKYPNYCVFRHSNNRKWFALIADVPKKKLGMDGEGAIYVLNLKLEPLLVDMLRSSAGFFPAYHMNKTTWITVLLNDTVPEEQIKGLIDRSFALTAPNIKKKQHYTFRNARTDETAPFFRLILERMRWMDGVGIEHWNRYDYDHLYPLSYYEEKCEQGELYVLVDEDTGEIVSGAVLPQTDEFWDNGEPAYYLHNFVAKLGAKGAGSAFVAAVERMAREQGKRYVRLDVLATSPKLLAYYEYRGYVEKGQCRAGDYVGILKEKALF